MNSKLTIILGLGAAFGLGLLVNRRPEPAKPLTNNTDAPVTNKSGPNGTLDHKKLMESGPKVILPSPSEEEILAIQTGKQLENRSFKDLSPEQLKILKDALEKLSDPSISEADALKILKLAAANYGPQILEIATAAMKHPSEEVRIQAMKLLQRNGDAGILPVAKLAIKDPAPNVRLSAVMALEQQRGPEVKSIFKSMLQDTDPNVVNGVVNAASNLPPGPAAEVLGEALASCPKDPAILAINCLAGLHNKEAIPALMRGLNSNDPEIKANAEHIFFSLTMELPPNPQQWWAENEKNFDDNLAPIIDGQPNEPVPSDLSIPNPPGK